MLLGSLFWYCEIQGFHTFLGLRRLDPHQGSALDLSGAYNVPRPPVMLSNDLRSLHILSKTRLSIPHLLGGGEGQNFKCVLQGGEENFLTLPLQENYIPPTHRKNDTSLRVVGQICREGMDESGILPKGRYAVTVFHCLEYLVVWRAL